MTYAVLKLAHIIGAILIGGGLIGVWLCDMRSRQSRMGSLLNFASHHQCVMEHRGWAGENVRVARAKLQPT